jgi:DNA-binding CsgD family transcriptional regulator
LSVSEEIVGRAAELAAVDRCLADAAQSSAALVLEGEAGIGKTTIWRAAVDAAHARGWLVLASRPARSEQALTLGALSDVFGGLPDDALAVLPEPQRHALEVALLRAEPSGRLPDQRALSVAAAGLLRSLALDHRPVLLAIDDAQWLDESSAVVLAYAVRRLADRPLRLVVSVRTGLGSAASDAIVGAAPPDRLERIAVGPLPLGSLHRLFEARLGRSYPRLALLQIEAASGGNPFYALEVARALQRSGADVLPGQPLPVPNSLGSLVADRIRELPATTRRALLLAAAAVEPALETLRDAGAGEPELAPATSGGIVAIDHGFVRFAHPLLAQAVLALADPPELRAAHAALAAATDSPAARARHLSQATTEPDEAVATAIERAAAEARARGATLDAATLYQSAARLTPDDAAGSGLRRALAAAECLFVDLSEIVQADAILAAALRDLMAPGPLRAEALSLRAIVRYYHGRVPEAVELGREAVDAAGDDPVVRARVLGRAAFVTMQLDLERGVAMVDEAVRLLDSAPDPVDPDLLANAVLLRAVGELGLVWPTRPGDVERGLALMTRDGRSWEHEGADGSAFGIARLTDDLDRAIAMTVELIRSKSGPAGDDPFNLVMLSGLLVYRGEWPEARRIAEAALAGYEREGEDIHPAWGLRGAALVAAHDGRLDDARRWAEQGLRLAAERGDVIVEVFHRQLLGFVALTVGDWARADAHLTAATVLADRIGTRHPGRFKLAGDQVEASLALGDVAKAEAAAARLDEAARVAPTPWVLAVAARSRALLAAAHGDLETALGAVDAALAEHERLAMPFERGRTLLVKGGLHRRRREKRLADETLREALAVFTELGAPAWADRAEAELGRVGIRPRASERLTDTELLVAELAASGLSNRRIAERSFLAPKTVGNVLGRVYEKLGIHSRAELGAQMGTARPPDGVADPEDAATAERG